MDQTAEYDCPSCGETIQIVIDPTGGDEQTYVEDCPVCCCPNVIHVSYDREGYADVRAEAE